MIKVRQGLGQGQGQGRGHVEQAARRGGAGPLSRLIVAPSALSAGAILSMKLKCAIDHGL